MGIKTQRGEAFWAYILTVTFDTTRMTELSAQGTGPTSTLRIFLGTHFC